MAYNTSNMGLHVWNLLTDHFNHSELEANWVAVDGHNHASGAGVQIPTGGLASNAVTNAKLADNAADSRVIAANAVGTSELADGTVTTAKIVDNTVTTAKVVDGAITSAKIADGTIATADIGGAQITKAKAATDLLNTFLKLGSGADRKITFGTGIWFWPGGSGRDNDAVVAHGLGTTPIAAWAIPVGNPSIYYSDGVAMGVTFGGLLTRDATNMTLTGRCGFAPSSGSTPFIWVAIG